MCLQVFQKLQGTRDERILHVLLPFVKPSSYFLTPLLVGEEIIEYLYNLNLAM